MVLLVFGMVSIAYMVQMPKEKQMHNVKRVIRGNPEVEAVELEPEEVVEPVVEPVKVEPEPGMNMSYVPETVVSIVAHEEEILNQELFSEYKTKEWNGCQTFKEGWNIREELRKQLEKVVYVFEKLNIKYALYAGTLIGALRDHDINKHEVDNDLMVPMEFKRTENIRRVFFAHGLHIFKDGIYRICNIGQSTTSILPWKNTKPWGSTYSTYTDLYAFLPHLHCNSKDVFSKSDWIKIQSYERIHISNFSAIIPNKIQAEKCLRTRYGSWDINDSGEKWNRSETWKKKVHNRFDKTLQVTKDTRYTQLKKITDALEDHGVIYYLASGSALGAVRIGGIMEHDKDIDIFVINAKETQIEKALNEASATWHYQNDGKGSGTTDFGYHITLKNTKTYVDIWMMSDKGDRLECVGHQNGCKQWMNKYLQFHHDRDDILPLRKLPFGSEQFMFPNKILNYLDKQYTDWRTMCGEWQRGKRKCKPEEFEYFNKYYKDHLDKLGYEEY